MTIFKRRVGFIEEDIGERNRWVIIDRLTEAGIRMEVGVRAEEITTRGVRVGRSDDTSDFFEADSVVIAVGMKASNTLAEELEGEVAVLFRVGDCVEPHRVREAIAGGFKAGLEV